MIVLQLYYFEVSKFTIEIRRKRSLNMGVSFNLEEQDGGIDREPSSSLSSWWSWRWEGLNAPRVDSSSCQQQVPKQEVEDREAVTIWIRTAVTGFHRHPPAILIPQPHSLFFADFSTLTRSWFDSSHTQHHQLPLDRFWVLLAFAIDHSRCSAAAIPVLFAVAQNS